MSAAPCAGRQDPLPPSCCRESTPSAGELTPSAGELTPSAGDVTRLYDDFSKMRSIRTLLRLYESSCANRNV
eukprot:6176631-Pyramimonas_sp.AAC.1